MATATDTLPHAPSQPSRRALIGALAAVPVTVALPATAGTAADPHLEWAAEWHRLVDWWNSPADPTKEAPDHPVWERLEQLGELIFDTPATTDAGLAAQLGVGLRHIGADDPMGEMEHMAEVRAMRSVRAALAGRA